MRWQFIMAAVLAAVNVCQGQFTFQDDAQRGRLHINEAGKAVLTYNYGMQLNTGAAPKYERSCYIHPLWDVNGWQRPITEDFPPLDGHLHHRGLAWTWPHVKVRGKQVQTWHPSNPPLRQHFVKWLARQADDKHALLAVENAWLLDDKEKVMTETVRIDAHPRVKVAEVTDPKRKQSRAVHARAIDLTLTFEAVGGPIELRGADGKGYGGLMLRGSADMKDGVITTDQGALSGDQTKAPHRWADLSLGSRGVAIFTSPDHPPHPKNPGKPDQPTLPPRWLLRTSYAGILNVAWPGIRPVTLRPGGPVTLKYRIYVHEGNAKTARVAQAYEQYLAGGK